MGHRFNDNPSKEIERRREWGRKYAAEMYSKHKVEINQKCIKHARRRKAVLRKELFSIYGDVCACCGETEKRFLTLEHINGSGLPQSNSKRLKTLGVEKVWKEAIEANDPTKFEILCYNCNWGRRINNGVCPHRDLRPSEE